MTDLQLYLVIAIPANLATNVGCYLMLGILRSDRTAGFAALTARFAELNQLFDETRDFWCAELRRFEQVLDVCLRALEERRRDR